MFFLFCLDLFTGNMGDDATQFVVKTRRVKDRIKVFCDEFGSHKVFRFYGDSIDVFHRAMQLVVVGARRPPAKSVN